MLPSRAVLNLVGDRIHALPLGIVYVTDRCNSRCVMCDYETRWVLLSGGEPLLHPGWAEIAEILAGGRRQLWLLTAGLALRREAETVTRLVQNITVSLDGATPETYRDIRGVNAFEEVCAGIRSVVGQGGQVSLRCTVQRRNYREMSAVVELAHELGVKQVSFLAIDVLTHVAFARREDIKNDLALAPADLPLFDRVLDDLDQHFTDDFRSGFIAESPAKLRRLRQYSAALHNLAEFPPVRCNAPRFSAVFTADRNIQPCFFISPSEGHQNLNDPKLIALRGDIRTGGRTECKTCVCSMQRGVGSFVLGS